MAELYQKSDPQGNPKNGMVAKLNTLLEEWEALSPAARSAIEADYEKSKTKEINNLECVKNNADYFKAPTKQQLNAYEDFQRRAQDHIAWETQYRKDRKK